MNQSKNVAFAINHILS